MLSIVFRSAPKIFTPTGVRMPVVSMSMRFLMGIVQALVIPGILSARSISSTSSSWLMCRARMWRRIRLSHSGAQVEYQRVLWPPLDFGLEHDSGLHHRKRRRIGGGLRAASLAEHALDFRERSNHPVLNLQEPLGFGHGDPGQSRGHVEQRAFIERRHELGPQALEDRHGHHHQGHCAPAITAHLKRSASSQPGDTAVIRRRLIGMLLLAVNLAHQNRVDEPGQPARAEFEWLARA